MSIHCSMVGQCKGSLNNNVTLGGGWVPRKRRSALYTARILCQSFTPKRHRQLRVKDLPKDHTWRLERDSNILWSKGFDSTIPPQLPTCITYIELEQMYVSLSELHYAWSRREIGISLLFQNQDL